MQASLYKFKSIGDAYICLYLRCRRAETNWPSSPEGSPGCSDPAAAKLIIQEEKKTSAP
jgi:hypothetical protein